MYHLLCHSHPSLGSQHSGKNREGENRRKTKHCTGSKFKCLAEGTFCFLFNKVLVKDGNIWSYKTCLRTTFFKVLFKTCKKREQLPFVRSLFLLEIVQW